MAFKLLMMNPGNLSERGPIDDWPARLKQAIPDIEVVICPSVDEAMGPIQDADAAFGDIAPELLARARRLRWIACPQAGPRAGYYYQALIDSDVVVTNTREIYNDRIGPHILSFVLAFARGLHLYMPNQLQQRWRPVYDTVHLPDSTAVIVGVGGIGGETARLCAEFGMRVIGIDPRRSEAPPGVAELYSPEALHDHLPEGDFVIVTVPETPETQGMFGSEQFRLMRPSAFFINIGRGATVLLDDLDAALRSGKIAGAGLDVFEIEPLPPNHPLWTAPGVLITPHVASDGPYLDVRRFELFIDNCIRFNDGQPLRNVVDKARWF